MEFGRKNLKHKRTLMLNTLIRRDWQNGVHLYRDFYIHTTP